MQIVIISGMSGAGKSYALHSLEDAGYYCIDNLPSQLLIPLLKTPQIAKHTHVAIGIDIRGGKSSLQETPYTLANIREHYPNTRLVYLFANPKTLLKRYSETRRRHPLSNAGQDLRSAITREADLLAPLAQQADLRIDTSYTSVYELGNNLLQNLGKAQDNKLVLTIQSFGFKHEAPSTSDFLFDMRCLPNPYWEPELRKLTGIDQPIIDWLEQHTQVEILYKKLENFMDTWLTNLQGAQRSYLTLSIGCTGGRHRSVYMAERLYKHYYESLDAIVLIEHRELMH